MCKGLICAVMGRQCRCLQACGTRWRSSMTAESLVQHTPTVAMATAVASVLGGPIAAGLLMLNGLGGLHGWQVSALDVEGALPALIQGSEGCDTLRNTILMP